jgi:hypothetical protein
MFYVMGTSLDVLEEMAICVPVRLRGMGRRLCAESDQTRRGAVLFLIAWAAAMSRWLVDVDR